jgi:UDP-N-acetyl-D-mannosaminuronic acid dehydrogenase
VTLRELRRRIETREAVIGVIGLGYVGLPLSCAFAQAGFRTIGLDLKAEHVASVNESVNPLDGDEPGLAGLLADMRRTGRLRATTDAADLADADVVAIAVETPIEKDHRPRLDSLTAACASVGGTLKRGALVIVESTIPPGTADGVIAPLLERATGLRLNEGFFLGHCPERVMPGKLLANLHSMSRVCGGSSAETAEIVAALYRTIVTADLDVTDCLTAELVKTVENAYRDVNIGFANEVALICEAVGGDVWKVRDLVNKSPGREMLLPGAGVGGHCIPKDPWLLVAGVSGFVSRVVAAGREVNDSMPAHVVDLIQRILQRANRAVADSKVALLGFSYLENSGHPHNSPTIAVAGRLRELGADVVIQDPHVRTHARSVPEAVQGVDCIALLVAHSTYRHLDWAGLRRVVRTATVVDARNIVEEATALSAGFMYVGLGKMSSVGRRALNGQ